MDGAGIVIFVIAGGLYLATERKYGALLFLSGIGAGIFVGAIWALMIIERVLP